MMSTPEGHIESVPMEVANPVGNLSDETKGEIVAPPRMGMEQLKARQQEIEEARLQLVQECAELDREIKHRGDGGRARAMARDVNRRIIADDEALPCFTRVS